MPNQVPGPVSEPVPKSVSEPVSDDVRALRVLGVDPGLTRCGLGVVDGPPSRPSAVDVEVVATDRDRSTAERLADLHREVARLIACHAPDIVACERVLFSANARTAMGVGQAAGVALLAAAQAGVPVVTYSPNDVKLTVAGHGGADKEAVARMVVAQLGLDERPVPVDATDALAVALCHLAHARIGAATGATAAAAWEDAARRAGAASGGGWEAVLDRPHVRVASDTGEAST